MTTARRRPLLTLIMSAVVFIVVFAAPLSILAAQTKELHTLALDQAVGAQSSLEDDCLSDDDFSPAAPDAFDRLLAKYSGCAELYRQTVGSLRAASSGSTSRGAPPSSHDSWDLFGEEGETVEGDDNAPVEGDNSATPPLRATIFRLDLDDDNEDAGSDHPGPMPAEVVEYDLRPDRCLDLGLFPGGGRVEPGGRPAAEPSSLEFLRFLRCSRQGIEFEILRTTDSVVVPVPETSVADGLGYRQPSLDKRRSDGVARRLEFLDGGRQSDGVAEKVEFLDGIRLAARRLRLRAFVVALLRGKYDPTGIVFPAAQQQRGPFSGEGHTSTRHADLPADRVPRC